jgi:GTPase SAR1 family protein
MNNWFEAFRETCPDAPVVICANKVDLTDKRMVPVEPGIMLEKWLQAEYYETSARTGSNVSDVFARMAEIVLVRTLSEQRHR